MINVNPSSSEQSMESDDFTINSNENEEGTKEYYSFGKEIKEGFDQLMTYPKNENKS